MIFYSKMEIIDEFAVKLWESFRSCRRVGVLTRFEKQIAELMSNSASRVVANANRVSIAS